MKRYEVSTRGDRRFSALVARLSDGRTIEQAWAEAKGYPTIQAAKGRPARGDNFDYYGTYKGLWGQWADENPQLMNELSEIAKEHVLVDSFARTQNNQARALSELLAERASAPAPERRGAFVIVPSRVPNPSYQHLGMREKGFNMATAPAPFAPGWLGNPMVANDAGGRVSREEATRYFRGVIEEKAQDPAWRDAFLSLDENTRVGYYKPEEEFIHLHELQKWILENRVSPEPAVAAAGGEGGGAPPVGPPVVVVPPRAEPPQAGPGGPEPASPMRMAGQAWPWIAAAAGGLAALGGGVVLLSSDDEAELPPGAGYPAGS